VRPEILNLSRSRRIGNSKKTDDAHAAAIETATARNISAKPSAEILSAGPNQCTNSLTGE
jgi:hypothetical protein